MKTDARGTLGILLISSIAVICAAPQSAPVPIRIDAVPVPLNPLRLTEVAIGDFVYAGGVQLTSRQTNRLHGLSDMFITGTDRLTAVTDEGTLLEARLVLDGSGRLVGLDDARVTPLTGENGKVLPSKVEADAEGLTRLSNGDRLVSFEHHHRILLYPAAGGPPHPAPMPNARFPDNEGMEALAVDLDSGPDAYTVGAESSGDTWTCRVSSNACVKGPTVEKGRDFGLVAIAHLPGMRTAYLLRAYSLRRGNSIALKIVRANAVIAEMDMALPMTVDNFEGLAAVPRSTGQVRFYLISDDNFSPIQRTLLLAFEWQAKP